MKRLDELGEGMICPLAFLLVFPTDQLSFGWV
jgi:hypothetical protein